MAAQVVASRVVLSSRELVSSEVSHIGQSIAWLLAAVIYDNGRNSSGECDFL
jgi:hypothetical protein